MDAQEFRTFLMGKAREFDRFAWKDARTSPADYEGYTKQDWWNMFLEFMETDIDG